MHAIDKRKLYPRVTDFYAGKSILLTGGAGLLGVVLLENLLRCCPGIKTIYAVIRSKKGVTAEKRWEEVMSRRIFDNLRSSNLAVFKKVVVVDGDVSQPNYGISNEDLQSIIENVTIVFHCAASISFLKPLTYLLSHNSGGVYYGIQICKRLKKLEAFVFTSTAYSNSNRTDLIQEKVYRLPYKGQDFIDALNKGDFEKLQIYADNCKPPWPNHYTFSKSVAENIVEENSSNIKSAIIRPSLISCVWKGSNPGYCEENSSLAQLMIGIGKGFIKILYGDPDSHMDLVAVDVVANAHIVAAWRLATDRCKSPMVVNCTSYGKIKCSLRYFYEVFIKMVIDFPLPNTFRLPDTVAISNSSTMYLLITAYEHYVPAYIMDLLLRIGGGKPKLVRLYKFFDTASETANYFISRNWNYETKNLDSLEDDLCTEDKELFYTNMCGMDIKDFAHYLPNAVDVYDWSKDKRKVSERMKIAKQRYYLTMSIKYAFLMLIGLLLYMILSVILKNSLIF